MSSVSETIVREYFELHEFLVRQTRKHLVQTRREDDDIDFFVLNPKPERSGVPLPFVLGSADLPRVERAIVSVKGWHTETFGPAVLTKLTDVLGFVQPGALKRAAKAFGEGGTPLKLLVVPTLPAGAEAQEQSITLLRSKGIDAVIPFRTMLADLIGKTETNRNYQKSDLLQVIRILKNYEFFKDPQMELFKTRKSRSSKPEPT